MGALAVLGRIYVNLASSEGSDLGLAMATVGLLSSTLLAGRWWCWPSAAAG